MFTGISIRPSKDIRTNYAEISALAKKNPVAITVNGREDTVVLSHEQYMEQQQMIADLQAKLEVYNHLACAQDDIIHGRVQSMDDAMNDIRKEMSKLKTFT